MVPRPDHGRILYRQIRGVAACAAEGQCARVGGTAVSVRRTALRGKITRAVRGGCSQALPRGGIADPGLGEYRPYLRVALEAPPAGYAGLQSVSPRAFRRCGEGQSGHPRADRNRIASPYYVTSVSFYISVGQRMIRARMPTPSRRAAVGRLTDIGFIMPSVRCALYCESRVPRTAQTVGLPRPSKAFSIWFLSMTLPSCVYTSITLKARVEVELMCVKILPCAGNDAAPTCRGRPQPRPE